MRDPPHEIQATPDLDERRGERAPHPAQEDVQHLERGEALHERRVRADLRVRPRGARDERGGAQRGAVEVEDDDERAEEEVRPAERGEDVIEDEVVLDERRRAC